MCVGSPTAGAWSSFQRRPDDEFETDRKSAIHIARHYAGRPRNFVGQHFWARGYFVSTVGRDEQAIRTYIRDQEEEDRRQEQLQLDPSGHL